MSGDRESLAGARHDMEQFSVLLDGEPRAAADALEDAADAVADILHGLRHAEFDGASGLAALTNNALSARCALARLQTALPREHAHRLVILDHARALLAEINRAETRVRDAFPEWQAALC